jgi:hypothetical protein
MEEKRIGAAPYSFPTVILASCRSLDDRIVTVVTAEDIRARRYGSLPFVPASLFDIGYQKNVVDFHRLIAADKCTYTFETYEIVDQLPGIGGQYLFGSNWVPDGLSAVIDVTLKWERKKYPADGEHEHDHCSLTWGTICSYCGEQEGYVSEAGWVSVSAFEEYIRKDICRYRRDIRAAALKTASIEDLAQAVTDICVGPWDGFVHSDDYEDYRKLAKAISRFGTEVTEATP